MVYLKIWLVHRKVWSVMHSCSSLWDLSPQRTHMLFVRNLRPLLYLSISCCLYRPTTSEVHWQRWYKRQVCALNGIHQDTVMLCLKDVASGYLKKWIQASHGLYFINYQTWTLGNRLHVSNIVGVKKCRSQRATIRSWKAPWKQSLWIWFLTHQYQEASWSM